MLKINVLLRNILFLLVLNIFVSLPSGAITRNYETIEEDYFKKIVNKGFIELPNIISFDIDQEAVGMSISEYVSVNDVKWEPSCTATEGNGALSLSLNGINNLQQTSAGLHFSPRKKSDETKIWARITTNSNVYNLSKKYVFICQLLGSQWWPLSFKNKPITNIEFTVKVPAPSCNISAPAQITMSTLSSANPSAIEPVDVTVTCTAGTDGLYYEPDVTLTVTGPDAQTNGDLYEDNNVNLQLLHGIGTAKENQQWKVDGLDSYPVGLINKTSKTVTPLIKASKKNNSSAGNYSTQMTITMNLN